MNLKKSSFLADFKKLLALNSVKKIFFKQAHKSNENNNFQIYRISKNLFEKLRFQYNLDIIFIHEIKVKKITQRNHSSIFYSYLFILIRVR